MANGRENTPTKSPPERTLKSTRLKIIFSTLCSIQLLVMITRSKLTFSRFKIRSMSSFSFLRDKTLHCKNIESKEKPVSYFNNEYLPISFSQIPSSTVYVKNEVQDLC
ncbi:13721_t:CDS:2, partial [Cetraspora pellucida]